MVIARIIDGWERKGTKRFGPLVFPSRGSSTPASSSALTNGCRLEAHVRRCLAHCQALC